MAYKVKYKERNALAWELKRVIRDLGLVDTWAMYDSVRISLTVEEDGNMNCIINTRFYYFFLDEGTKYIAPQRITDKWFKRPKVQAIFLQVYSDFLEWYVQKYDVLKVPKKLDKLRNRPVVTVDFNYIGSDTPSYLK
jgi:hypothetical protein